MTQHKLYTKAGSAQNWLMFNTLADGKVQLQWRITAGIRYTMIHRVIHRSASRHQHGSRRRVAVPFLFRHRMWISKYVDDCMASAKN